MYSANLIQCIFLHSSPTAKKPEKKLHYFLSKKILHLSFACCLLKELNKRFTALSKNAQEVQRDLTIRRCVIDEKKLSDVLSTSQKLKIDLGAHSTRVDDLQSTFQQIWEEQLDRVRAQQEMYRVKLIY